MNEILTKGEKRYFMTFIDDCTRFSYAVAKLALAIRRGSSLFFSSFSLLLPCFFSKWKEGLGGGGLHGKTSGRGGLSPDRPTAGFATAPMCTF
jgi:hypothetical protein